MVSSVDAVAAHTATVLLLLLLLLLLDEEALLLALLLRKTLQLRPPAQSALRRTLTCSCTGEGREGAFIENIVRESRIDLL
jgi:hypothetical protein